MTTARTHQRLGRVRLRALVVGALAVVGGVASYVFAVQSTVGQAAEATVLGAAQFTTDPPAPLNLVSAPATLVALILIGGVALAAHGMRRAALATIAPAIAIFASQILKLQILDRPGLFELDAPNTFPSGHMTVFAALLGGILIAVPLRFRGFFAVAGALLLSSVSWQLLAFGWHRPSDIIGSLALTVAVFALAIMLAPGAALTGRQIGASGVILMVTGVIALVAALALGGAALTLTIPDQTSATILLLAGEMVGVGVSLLAARGFLALGSSHVQ